METAKLPIVRTMAVEKDDPAGLALYDYFSAVRRNWLIVVACTLLGVGAAVGLSLIVTPQYRASTSLYVSVQSTSGTGASELTQGGSYARQAVRTYVDIIEDAIVLEPVIRDLDLDMTPAELAEMVSASSPPETVRIVVDVTGPDPEEAAAIANSIGTNFADVVSNVLEKPNGGGASPVTVSTTQEATAPTSPVSPRTMRNAAYGLFVGLVAGLSLALLRYVADSRVRSQRDVERITDVPVLGGITDDPKADRQRLVVHVNPRSVRAESFRSLRTNLQFVNVDDSPRSFVITSAAPNEGKTTVATNLAVSLSQTGASVVLVDADLRKPSIATHMGLDGAVGLSNTLVGMIPLDDVVTHWGKHELWVLPAGRIPPNPSELLGSEEMQRTIDTLTARFDYVIVDAPPVLAVTDAAVISRLVGGTILVAGLGMSRRNEILSALDALGGVANRIVGIVLTHVSSKGPDAYYHYGRAEGETANRGKDAGRVLEDPLGWLESEARRPRRHTT